MIDWLKSLLGLDSSTSLYQEESEELGSDEEALDWMYVRADENGREFHTNVTYDEYLLNLEPNQLEDISVNYFGATAYIEDWIERQYDYAETFEGVVELTNLEPSDSPHKGSFGEKRIFAPILSGHVPWDKLYVFEITQRGSGFQANVTLIEAEASGQVDLGQATHQ